MTFRLFSELSDSCNWTHCEVIGRGRWFMCVVSKAGTCNYTQVYLRDIVSCPSPLSAVTVELHNPIFGKLPLRIQVVVCHLIRKMIEFRFLNILSYLQIRTHSLSPLIALIICRWCLPDTVCVGDLYKAFMWFRTKHVNLYFILYIDSEWTQFIAIHL